MTLGLDLEMGIRSALGCFESFADSRQLLVLLQLLLLGLILLCVGGDGILLVDGLQNVVGRLHCDWVTAHPSSFDKSLDLVHAHAQDHRILRTRLEDDTCSRSRLPSWHNHHLRNRE